MAVDNKLALPIDSFSAGLSHLRMASGNPVLGKTVKPDATWPAGKSSVRVQSGWVRYWANRLARLCVWGRFNVPVGYEDETGFHFGTPDSPRNQNNAGAESCAMATPSSPARQSQTEQAQPIIINLPGLAAGSSPDTPVETSGRG